VICSIQHIQSGSFIAVMSSASVTGYPGTCRLSVLQSCRARCSDERKNSYSYNNSQIVRGGRGCSTRGRNWTCIQKFDLKVPSSELFSRECRGCSVVLPTSVHLVPRLWMRGQGVCARMVYRVSFQNNLQKILRTWHRSGPFVTFFRSACVFFLGVESFRFPISRHRLAHNRFYSF
jgi:hypothetical protein